MIDESKLYTSIGSVKYKGIENFGKGECCETAFSFDKQESKASSLMFDNIQIVTFFKNLLKDCEFKHC